MQADNELKDLRSREARARQAILKLAEEIRAVIADDLLKFPAREVRSIFVSDPVFAETVGDSTIKKIKAELAERSPAVRDRIMDELNEDERWLAGLELGSPGESLAENERLWAPFSLAVDLVREVLSAYDFPVPRDPLPGYKMPTWFISGKYLPGLAEKYWNLISETRDIMARIREVEDLLLRHDLGKRWDEIGKEG